MYNSPTTIIQVNGKHLGSFAIKRSFGNVAPCPLFSISSGLEPLLRRFSECGTNQVRRGILFHRGLRAMVSAYADDVLVFVSSCDNVEAVKRALSRHDKVSDKYGKERGNAVGSLEAWHYFSWTFLLE